MIDHDGYMAYSYPADVAYTPQETAVGGNCYAQACIGVWHAGNLQINVSKKDSDGVRQSAIFYLEVYG